MIGHHTEMTRACPHCRSTVPHSAFCRVCGAALPPVAANTRARRAPWNVLAIVGAVLVLAVATVLIVLRVGGGGVGGTAVAGPDGGGATATASTGDRPSTAADASRVTAGGRPPTVTPGTAPPTGGAAGTADTNAYRGYALADGQPLTQDTSGYAVYFSSPSKNIHCTMAFGTADLDGDATCFIGEKQWAGPTAPTSCAANWADNYVSVSVAGVQSGRCLSDVPVPPVSTELPYGKSLSTGAVTCASAETGVTCIHLASGHGFTISRSNLTPF